MKIIREHKKRGSVPFLKMNDVREEGVYMVFGEMLGEGRFTYSIFENEQWLNYPPFIFPTSSDDFLVLKVRDL